ncbi:metal ABC transporter permease [Clostridium bornimense]|uniref:metal ABC transporter permease n=1 Tax=Clostridium bornimense TaxID=1216932 RepID=UPI001C0F98DE|nr:metal ABC transporter permease [Clostridium bornimense]MBU5316759.1 metal ABC transporter permease [Clostridium bornimense]
MFQYDFMIYALIGGMLISLICPAIGTFLVLKRYSLMGDTLAHASFAGIALGIATGTDPVLSAVVFTSISGVVIEFLSIFLKKYGDLIMSIILTFSVGIAITLISTGKTKTNINSYLFGSILTITPKDLYIIGILSVVTFIILFFLFNSLIYLTFDEDGAKIAGIKVKILNYIFILLVSLTISISIKIVGILVISSLIAIPVATSLQLKKGFKQTFIYSIIFGVIDVNLGLVLSFYLDGAPGGFIALSSVAVLILTILSKSIVTSIKKLKV